MVEIIKIGEVVDENEMDENVLFDGVIKEVNDHKDEVEDVNVLIASPCESD